MGNNGVECMHHLNRLVCRAAASNILELASETLEKRVSFPRVHMFSPMPERKFGRMKRTA